MTVRRSVSGIDMPHNPAPRGRLANHQGLVAWDGAELRILKNWRIGPLLRLPPFPARRLIHNAQQDMVGAMDLNSVYFKIALVWLAFLFSAVVLFQLVD